MENKHLIFSVIGGHAGEDEHQIFFRKKEDIKKYGWVLWLFKSHRAKPEVIQAFCKSAQSVGSEALVGFLWPRLAGSATQTQTRDYATGYSKNSIHWENIPNGMEVTGKVDGGAYAFFMDSIQLGESKVDLSMYRSFPQQQEIRPMPGGSTICGTRVMPTQNLIKPNVRRISAVARLREPFCVYLRKK